MRKANQQPATSTYTENDLSNLLGHLDTGARKRKVYTDNIEKETERARRIEVQIGSLQEDLRRSKAEARKLETELAALPEAGMDINAAKALLDRIASMPWIAKVELEGNILHLYTRAGVLKTDFYNRMVFGNGNRANELLQEVATLPLPEYEITLDLRNMGSSWAVNPALSIRLHNPNDYNSFAADEGGWVHEPRPHWGCNNTGGNWGTLCLGDYDRVLFEASKKGLLELLSELAIYLQRSGWSAAYINKTAWSILLGNPVYNQYLIRQFAPGEDVDTLMADKRKRLPEFLKDNNITNNMYEYGSDSSDDDDDRRCWDCDCESDGEDDDCECECHI